MKIVDIGAKCLGCGEVINKRISKKNAGLCDDCSLGWKLLIRQMFPFF